MPLQALVQQRPSTQKPLPQSVPVPQLAPLGLAPVWQIAAASQYWLVPHDVSVAPGSTLPQTPRRPGTLQAWQVPVQAPLQQMPSTQ